MSRARPDHAALFRQLRAAGFDAWVDELETAASGWFTEARHGDYPRWAAALEALPPIADVRGRFDAPEVTIEGRCADSAALRDALMRLSPWRKGPWRFADVTIDSEWRSDWKWARVRPHLSDLRGRRILDVGCGNGYHAWRMLADDPSLVLGIDPSVLFNLQFLAAWHYLRDPRIHLLPLTIQAMPENLQYFDTVLSMGVLYHRRSPFDHLIRLKGLLRPGGELCLETLVIDGSRGEVLVPAGRYARMNNVWFLPSVPELEHWLRRAGFTEVRCVDLNRTTVEEQRSTEWMRFESLPQCLDPADADKTVEGYPAPLRAVMLARRP
jgi:tRNA (mo5U34)-methyltransferase